MMSAGISTEGTTNQISTRWQYLSTQGKQKTIPSSWIQMGPAKACGGWETEHKSFSAGSVQNVFPSTLLTLFSDLREDLTRHQIFTQCGSSWTGFHLHLTSDVFLGACGKAFHFHRSRSWWWGWLTLTGPSMSRSPLLSDLLQWSWRIPSEVRRSIEDERGWTRLWLTLFESSEKQFR